MKALDDLNEYCLVENIELEQQIVHEDSSMTNSTSNELSSNNNQKKVIVKTRVLGPNENLFLLTHVWNQMRNEKKDGFKYAKVILTKKNL